MTESYEVYTPSAPGDAPAEGPVREAPWHVAIEYSNDGQAKPPTVVQIRGNRYDDKDRALAAAEKEAFRYQPPDPYAPQGRRVFRDGDGFLVVLQGAMSTFHMSVRVVQYVGDA